MEEFLEWFFCLSVFGGLAGVLMLKWKSDTCVMEQGDRMGVSGERVNVQDCRESVFMLVRFITGGLEKDGRKYNECLEAGCDGSSVLADSKDISLLVKAAHSVGGQLVVRKVADRDIECKENTLLEVQVKLTDIDVARAKRLRGKERRGKNG